MNPAGHADRERSQVTEAVSMAAQKACRTIGIGQYPAAWSYLGPEE